MLHRQTQILYNSLEFQLKLLHVFARNLKLLINRDKLEVNIYTPV